MKAHELQTTDKKNRLRAGRGISAGRGKTAGRGTKGQNSRAGGKRRPGFEGGQNPMFKRLPKQKGFRSYLEPKQTITTDILTDRKGTIDNTNLAETGVIDNQYVSVKLVLGKQELTTKLNVNLQAASKSAIAAVEKAGGSFTQAARPARPSKKDNKKDDK